MDKEKIRKKLIHKRRALTQLEVKKNSSKIFHRLISTDEFKNAKTILFYVSKDNEARTIPTIEFALKNKKIVCVPKVDVTKHIFHPIRISSSDKDLHKGHFGIHEPLFETKNIVPVKNIDLIIVPGIAFDLNGHRLGWGKGYYDKFLEKAKRIHKIGLAFDFQILPELPKDKHDVPVDMVMTEKRTMKAIRKDLN